MLSSKQNSQEHFMKINLVPASLYQRAQTRLLKTRRESGSRENKGSHTGIKEFPKTPFRSKSGSKSAEVQQLKSKSGRNCAALRLKPKLLTPEQQLNQYKAPIQVFTKEKPAPEVNKEPEVDEEQQRREFNSLTKYIRHVRDLIREKYRLDIHIWSKRDTIESNRSLILESCKRSDAILNEIFTIVKEWERDLFTAEEWAIVSQIQQGVARCTQDHSWQAVPPWSRSGNSGLKAY